MLLPTYVDNHDIPIPGLGPDDPEPYKYYALLNNSIQSTKCEIQVSDDRLYCMFPISQKLAGTVASYALYLEGCDNSVFESKFQIPGLRPGEKITCNEGMGRDACQETGGTYIDSLTRSPYGFCFR